MIGAAFVALVTFGVLYQQVDLHHRSSGMSRTVGGQDFSTKPSNPGPSSNDRNELAQRVARARFFDTQVVPLIAEVDGQNRAAASRCIDRIHRIVGGYHEGVDRFVNDMTSLSTRFGVLKRMPGGWWAGDRRVEQYVQSKFEEHLFSEQKLVDDISAALLQFRQDIDANQMSMLTRIRAALSSADLPGVQLQQREEFFRSLSVELGDYAADQGTTSVENMLGAFVLGEVGAFAARSLIAGLLARFAPSVAISTAAGASATVGASATGAGGGSIGGPIGTVVGFGAGLAIGLVIDWWMTERFESELSSQMHVYLNDLESTLISGGSVEAAVTKKRPNEEAAARSGGLKSGLDQLCDSLRDAYRDRFFHQIIDGETS